MIVSACGDGAGGVSTEPLPPGDGRPDPPAHADPSDFETTEYGNNWGLGGINASTSYAHPGRPTGQGVLTAVFDDGLNDIPDLVGKIREDLSWSYLTENGMVSSPDYHGTYVACVIACARNGEGTHGVAHGSDLMILQGIDSERELDWEMIWVDMSDRTIRAGVHSVNHSWVYVPDERDMFHGNPRFGEGAITRSDYEYHLGQSAVTAIRRMASDENDIVQVFASGNDGRDQPNYLAGLPTVFSDLDGYVINAVAIDRYDEIAEFSNRCGDAMRHCLAAPGVGISISGRSGIQSVDGTSFAVPHIVGGHNVLRSAFPEMTGRQITYLLYDTARDLGEPGVDRVYGRGAMDLAAALAPQGMISLQTAGTLNAGQPSARDSVIVGQGHFGRALMDGLGDHSVLVTDVYDRGFQVSGGDFVVPVDTIDIRLAALRDSVRRPVPPLFKGRNHIMRLDMSGLAGIPDVHSLTLERPGSGEAAVSLGDLRLSARTAFSAQDASVDGTYVSFGLAETPADGPAISFDLGYLREDGGVLGSPMEGAFGHGVRAESLTATLGLSASVGPSGLLGFDMSVGNTEFATDGYLSRGELTTHAYGVRYTRERVFGATDSLGVSLSSPLSVREGMVGFDRPVALRPAVGGARDPVIDTVSSDVDLGGSVVPVDVSVSYRKRLDHGDFSVVALRSFGAGRETGLGLDLSWSF